MGRNHVLLAAAALILGLLTTKSGDASRQTAPFVRFR